MIESLYEIFRRWSDGGSVYLIGDTHFCDKDCLSIDPKWPSPEEQVKIINKRVTKKDTLIILGDVGNTEYVAKLHGYKVLIAGNHDAGEDNYIRKKDYVVGDKWVDNHLFDEVYTGPLMIGERLLLSHEPIDYKYALNIHGHCHNGEVKDKYHLNLAANVCNYTPVSLSDIIKSGRLKKIETIHRVTIDKASNKRAPVQMGISKKEYVQIFLDIVTQKRKMNEFSDALNKVCDGYPVFDYNNKYLSSLLNLVRKLTNDTNDLISWLIWEDVKHVIYYTDENGDEKEIDVESPGKLYDYLSGRNMKNDQ